MASTRRSRLASTLAAVAGITIIAVLGQSSAAPPVAEPTTFLIVRHADRDGEKDALTSTGVARAQELAHVVGKASIAGVYCTKTVRTRKTAEPVATALALAPVELEPNDVDGLVKHVLANHRGKTVLVVAHSNTVPKIIAAAGGPKIADLAENEFDNLFVLDVPPEPVSGARLVNLQYGAASP